MILYDMHSFPRITKLAEILDGRMREKCGGRR
jgi:hypothetical protein